MNRFVIVFFSALARLLRGTSPMPFRALDAQAEEIHRALWEAEERGRGIDYYQR